MKFPPQKKIDVRFLLSRDPPSLDVPLGGVPLPFACPRLRGPRTSACGLPVRKPKVQGFLWREPHLDPSRFPAYGFPVRTAACASATSAGKLSSPSLASRAIGVGSGNHRPRVEARAEGGGGLGGALREPPPGKPLSPAPSGNSPQVNPSVPLPPVSVPPRRGPRPRAPRRG